LLEKEFCHCDVSPFGNEVKHVDSLLVGLGGVGTKFQECLKVLSDDGMEQKA
jgi:hypothetical protein